MDSPLLEARPCPTCPGLIAGADPHRFCFECLGADHAMEGGGNSPTCSACRALPRLRRIHRLDHFQQARYAVPEDDLDRGDVEVVEMDEEVPFVFALPASRAAPLSEEGEDEDFSLSGVSGSVGPPRRSVNQDFPVVMAMAAERVGLELPPPLPPRPVSRLRQGFYGPVQPAQPAFVSPLLPDVWQCVEATWRQPLRARASVAGMTGLLRLEGHPDSGCPGVPPLDESLAAHLLPQAAGWAEGRRPLPPLPRDREALEYLDRIFRLGAQMAAAANNLGVLGVSLITPQPETSAPSSQDDPGDYADRCIGQINNLVNGVAAAAGRVMSLATVGSRHVWLGLTALSRSDRDDLLGAPISTAGLFGSVTAVTQRFRRLEEEREQLSRMLPLALPQRGERGPTVRRRDRRRASVPMASVASPAYSPSSARRSQRAPRGQAGRFRRNPPPAPRQQRAAGWGAPSARS